MLLRASGKRGSFTALTVVSSSKRFSLAYCNALFIKSSDMSVQFIGVEVYL